ncbi:MAG: hypothetical protein CL521_00605 [Actinobacteria bacterium]|nr:hypothetical protein [Actinomycetota bacterium]
MKPSKQHNHIAWGLSLAIHAALFLIPAPPADLSTNQDVIKQMNRIPVSIKAPPPVPPKKASARKPIKKKKRPKQVSNKKIIKKVAQKAPPKITKPQAHPDDQTHPKLIHLPQPVPPKSAINEGWKGQISVKVTVNENGQISQHQIIQSTGYPLLDDAYIRHLLQKAKFKPKQEYGIKKSDIIVLNHTFQ